MEYRNTAKTKSETRKSASAAINFGVVLNMFTIPKVMFSKNLQLFSAKYYDNDRRCLLDCSCYRMIREEVGVWIKSSSSVQITGMGG